METYGYILFHKLFSHTVFETMGLFLITSERPISLLEELLKKS